MSDVMGSRAGTAGLLHVHRPAVLEVGADTIEEIELQQHSH